MKRRFHVLRTQLLRRSARGLVRLGAMAGRTWDPQVRLGGPRRQLTRPRQWPLPTIAFACTASREFADVHAAKLAGGELQRATLRLGAVPYHWRASPDGQAIEYFVSQTNHAFRIRRPGSRLGDLAIYRFRIMSHVPSRLHHIPYAPGSIPFPSAALHSPPTRPRKGGIYPIGTHPSYTDSFIHPS